MTPQIVIRTYLTLMLGNTFAASLIWGINTIFLLDAGLTNLEAFAANAFFTVGMVLFEIPTGVVADTLGRRASYLMGTITLAISTILYVILWQMHAPFWEWAVVSMLLGLGFTFFSGAVEAWLVDALQGTGYKGSLESVFGKGQAVSGVAMLAGSVAGGVLAQVWGLGVPFVLRGVILIVMFAVAFKLMRDIGFTPERSKQPLKEMRKLLKTSIRYGFGNPPVRWIMLAAPFASGVGIYAFYAMQPYLLQLYGDPKAYTIAGLVAALVAGAQIAGGFAAPHIRKLVRRRTSALVLATVLSAGSLILVGSFGVFWVVLVLVALWGLIYAAVMPIRQSYLNSLIPSKQRATVLSFDSLMGSAGGVVTQPVLGRVADVSSYGMSFVAAGLIDLLAVPFLLLARREKAAGDFHEEKKK
jgi:MFS family permease